MQSTLRCSGGLLLAFCQLASADFAITHSFAEPADFSAEQMEVFNEAFSEAAQLWEAIIIGYQGSDRSVVFPVEIIASKDGLAAASPGALRQQGDFVLPSQGQLWMNPSEIISTANGFGIADGNFLDELLAHEIAHALGFGSLWQDEVYAHGTGEYRGEFGLAAYRDEFDANAEFIPVELAGGGGSANSHWDQRFRSSPQEGNPDDPFSLSPLLGIVDHRGRDLGQELMGPALDPDFGEPFLSNTTVQSLRDIGYSVIPAFPRPGDVDENGVIDPTDVDLLGLMIRNASGDPFFDVNSDDRLDNEDYQFWVESIAMTVPGDANFDKSFDSNDLSTVFQLAEYEDGEALNSTWREGDWNGDGEFDSGDLVVAFSTGAFERNALIVVPEPSAFVFVLIFALVASSFRATGRMILAE